MSTPLNYRRLTPSDEVGLTKLYDGNDGPSLPFLKSLNDKPSGVAWCVLSGGHLLAVVWLNIFKDEAEIIDFRVDISKRRQGVGRYLLDETLSALNLSDIKAVFLEVRRSNVAAITLYEHAGFATIGIRKNYYETALGREDALLMRHDSNKR